VYAGQSLLVWYTERRRVPAELGTLRAMVVTVQDIIDYLHTNFSLDAEVHLDKDGWNIDELKPKDVQDLIRSRSIFEDYKGDLFINN
jgi:hypothetical protein